MREDRLRKIPFFEGLSKKEIKLLATQTDELDVRAGKELATEGEFGHEFFVIEEGTADVFRVGEKSRELGPGDFFGEIARLEEDRRTATVKAPPDMSVIVMTRADF